MQSPYCIHVQFFIKAKNVNAGSCLFFYFIFVKTLRLIVFVFTSSFYRIIEKQELKIEKEIIMIYSLTTRERKKVLRRMNIINNEININSKLLICVNEFLKKNSQARICKMRNLHRYGHLPYWYRTSNPFCGTFFFTIEPVWKVSFLGVCIKFYYR